jgi:hypothetical protein
MFLEVIKTVYENVCVSNFVVLKKISRAVAVQVTSTSG